MAYVFTHATVLDGTEGMAPLPNMTVVVDDAGCIDKVGPAASTVPPAGAEEIDLAGAYLMPGLINAHVHLCGSGKPLSAGGAGRLIDGVVGNPDRPPSAPWSRRLPAAAARGFAGRGEAPTCPPGFPPRRL